MPSPSSSDWSILDTLARIAEEPCLLPESRRASMLSFLDSILMQLGEDGIDVLLAAIRKAPRRRSQHWGRPVDSRAHDAARKVNEHLEALFGSKPDDFRRTLAAEFLVPLSDPSSPLGRAVRRWIALQKAEKGRQEDLGCGRGHRPLSSIELPEGGVIQVAAVRRDVERHVPYLAHWSRKNNSAK